MSAKIDVADLRVGMFVHLDLGWMAHPFAVGSFAISAEQLDKIRGLGLTHVRWSPEKSSFDSDDAAAPAAAAHDGAAAEPVAAVPDGDHAATPGAAPDAVTGLTTSGTRATRRRRRRPLTRRLAANRAPRRKRNSGARNWRRSARPPACASTSSARPPSR